MAEAVLQRENHQLRNCREQALAPGAGQVDKQLRRPAAIGGMGLISQVDEVGLVAGPPHFPWTVSPPIPEKSKTPIAIGSS